MLAALALSLAFLHVPGAVLESGSSRVPLTVSSWCIGGRCGAPIAASTRVTVAPRGGVVRCAFGFAPRRVAVNVGGAPVAATGTGTAREWRVTRGGGVTITATAPGLFVTYVGRLALR